MNRSNMRRHGPQSCTSFIFRSRDAALLEGAEKGRHLGSTVTRRL